MALIEGSRLSEFADKVVRELPFHRHTVEGRDQKYRHPRESGDL
jgi:hypothetical protein